MKKTETGKLLLIVLAVLVFAGLSGGLCPFQRILGIPCLSCGMTRAYEALLHGDLKSAFFWHPLFPLAPLVIYAGFLKMGNPFRNKTWNNIFWIVMGVLFVGCYIWRMAVFFPNTPPMNFNQNSIIGVIYTIIFK